jgi:hypothetical protein
MVFQSVNRTRQAEVEGGRQTLRVTERQMPLDPQLKRTRDRFNVGEVIRTDEPRKCGSRPDNPGFLPPSRNI